MSYRPNVTRPLSLSIIPIKFGTVNFLDTVPNYGPVRNDTGRNLVILAFVNRCISSVGVASGTVVVQIGATSGGSEYGQQTVTTAAQVATGKVGRAFSSINGFDIIPPDADIFFRVSTAGGGNTTLTGDVALYCVAD